MYYVVVFLIRKPRAKRAGACGRPPNNPTAATALRFKIRYRGVSSSPYTVHLCLGVRGPLAQHVAELCSVAMVKPNHLILSYGFIEKGEVVGIKSGRGTRLLWAKSEDS
jgi:hypothetical protein